MVISALTIYFLASLPGEAQKFKMKGEAMPTALLSCRERRGRGLSFPGRAAEREATEPWHHRACAQHHGNTCRNTMNANVVTQVVQVVRQCFGRLSQQQSRADCPCCGLPKSVIGHSSFLSENSRNEYLSLSLLPLIFYSHNKPTCELP